MNKAKIRKRESTKRFKFDYESYDADLVSQRMLHIKIFCEGAMQVDLWLNEDDQKALKKVLEDE